MSKGCIEGIHVLEEFVCEAIAIVGAAPDALPESDAKPGARVVDKPAKPPEGVEGRAENPQTGKSSPSRTDE
jgi:hypothetical protein